MSAPAWAMPTVMQTAPVSKPRVPLRLIWARLLRAVRALSASEVGLRAKFLFVALIALYLGINGLNVVNSYVGRDFMSAIQDRDMSAFLYQAARYAAVFIASTLAAVFASYAQERLGLLWREWLTRRLVGIYLDKRVYHRLFTTGAIANPDERISDDVRAFTTTTLSFVLMLLNGTLTTIAFSSVTWSISPTLFAVAVGYATLGSLMTIVLGRPLIWLNYTQLDKEANFRADLIHVRENTESIALSQHEARLKTRLLHRLRELVDNYQRMIIVNRNLGFFTTGYNYMLQLIPALIVAPLFIHGKVEFGVVTQASMAFSQLLGAFSLIVTQFQQISSFAAVIARLSALQEANDQAQVPIASAIEVAEDDGRIAYEHLTLRSRGDDRILINALSAAVTRGTRVLITGPDENAKGALFRATAGLWNAGEGTVIRPGLDQINFLPERPYLPLGTLRELLKGDGASGTISDYRIVITLHELDLDLAVAKAGGLDAERDWDDCLSLGEQQRLALARTILARPKFAFLDQISTVLTPEQIAMVLEMLTANSITYLALGKNGDDPRYYDAVLELAADGSWKWKATPST